MARVRREGWERIVADYRRSGLTQSDFARRHGVKLTTLQSWLYRPRAGARRTAAFVPVTVRPVGVAREDRIELELAGRSVLRFSAGTDLGYLLCLAEGLRSC